MRHHMLRSVLCAALMASGSAALAQEDPSQEPQDPSSSSPEPSSPAPAASPTPAPKPAGTITALVKAVPQRTVFVGDEPVTIVYYVVAATGVAVYPEPLTALQGKFTVASVEVGERSGIPGVKDLHVQRVTLVVRFPHDASLGVHEIPGTSLKYSREITVEKDGSFHRTPQSGTVAVPAVKLEKVLAYVETDVLHEVTFLGDSNTARLTVHVGPEAELLNEDPPEGAPAPEGVAFLSAFKPTEPFALLSTSRTSHDTGTYRITTFVYQFSVLDIGTKPFPFPFPSVQVRRRGDAQSQITVIAPQASGITIRPRVDKKTPAEPLKGVVADPAREHLLLWQMPVALGGLSATFLVLTGLTSLVGWARSRKNRKRRGAAVIDDDPVLPEPVYETGLVRRWIIRHRAQAELVAYNYAPDRASCERMAAVVARLLAAHTRGTTRVDRARALTLAAADFPPIKHARMAGWQRVLTVAQQCLERNAYTTITGGKE